MTHSHLALLSVRFGQLRKTAHLSQAEFASHLGVSQSAISQIERGRRTPSLQLLAKAAAVLDVSLPELLIAPSEGPVTRAEKQLLYVYRSLAAPAQDQLRAFAEFLSQSSAQE